MAVKNNTNANTNNTRNYMQLINGGLDPTLIAKYSYNDPMFALGAILSQAWANNYNQRGIQKRAQELSDSVNGTISGSPFGDMQFGTAYNNYGKTDTPVNFSDSLVNAQNKLSVGPDGTVSYHAPAFIPAMYSQNNAINYSHPTNFMDFVQASEGPNKGLFASTPSSMYANNQTVNPLNPMSDPVSGQNTVPTAQPNISIAPQNNNAMMSIAAQMNPYIANGFIDLSKKKQSNTAVVNNTDTPPIQPSDSTTGPIQPTSGPIQPVTTNSQIKDATGPIQPITGPIQPTTGPIQSATDPTQSAAGTVSQPQNAAGGQSAQGMSMQDVMARARQISGGVDSKGNVTPVKTISPVMTQQDSAIIQRNPQAYGVWLNKVNNQNMLAAPTTAKGSANIPDIQYGPESQAFSASAWEQQQRLAMLKKGYPPAQVEAALDLVRPQAEQREQDYNSSMTNGLSAAFNDYVRQGRYADAGIIAQQMLPFNSQLASYYMTNLPNAKDFYSTGVKQQLMSQEQANKLNLMGATTKQKERLAAITHNYNLDSMGNKAVIDAAAREQSHGYKMSEQENNAKIRAAYSQTRNGSNGNSDKLDKSDRQSLNQFETLYEKAMKPIDDAGHLDRDAVDSLTQEVNKNAGKYDDDTRTRLNAMAYIAQGQMEKADGNEEDAAKAWGYVPRYLLEELLPRYNWDGYK
jgi:hypothetical protein